MLRLKSYTSFPSGEFQYVHPEPYKVFGGDGLSIEQQAQRVSEFRKGNSLPRSDLKSCVEDIEAYSCARLGVGQWCFDTDAPYEPQLGILQAAASSGSCCGAHVK